MVIRNKIQALLAGLLVVASGSCFTPAYGQPPNARAAATPKATAPIDLTGQWVSVVTEDWRWRMVTPAKGDFTSVPLNVDGRKVGNTWDPTKDEVSGNQCKSYGAPAIMRVPGRLRISWTNEDTLNLETDAGTQKRAFSFKTPTAAGGDWQGVSEASWELVGGARGRGPQAGSLKVVTTKFKAGYLRRNGVPYSEKAVLTEYFDVTKEADGETWLFVTTIVEDPTYLQQPFVTSTNFRKQRDTSGWNPTPCSAR